MADLADPEEPSPEARQFVRKAMQHYGAYFSSVALQSEQDANRSLQQISDTDGVAEAQLDAQDFQYYRSRRNYLMGLFYEQLIREVRGQVQEELMRDAKGLLDKLQITKD